MDKSIKLGSLQWGVVGLTLITAVIHLVLGVGSEEPLFKVLFILNGLGYIALVAALYFLGAFAGSRSLLRWSFIAFTAVTVVLYFVSNGADAFESVFGLADKAVEIVLIILLFLDGR